MTTPREYEEESKRIVDRRRLYDQKKWKQRKTCSLGRGHKWSYPDGGGFMDSTRRTCSKCETRQIFVRTIWGTMEWMNDVHSPSFPIPFPSYSEDTLPGDVKIEGQTEYEGWKAKRWTLVLIVINICVFYLLNHVSLWLMSEAEALRELIFGMVVVGIMDAVILYYLWVGIPYCNPF